MGLFAGGRLRFEKFLPRSLLGHFAELEVVLEPGEDETLATVEANHLMDQLGITKDDLVRVAYIDMITSQI